MHAGIMELQTYLFWSRFAIDHIHLGKSSGGSKVSVGCWVETKIMYYVMHNYENSIGDTK